MVEQRIIKKIVAEAILAGRKVTCTNVTRMTCTKFDLNMVQNGLCHDKRHRDVALFEKDLVNFLTFASDGAEARPSVML